MGFLSVTEKLTVLMQCDQAQRVSKNCNRWVHGLARQGCRWSVGGTVRVVSFAEILSLIVAEGVLQILDYACIMPWQCCEPLSCQKCILTGRVLR